VALVCILDADKQGFLRSQSSLIQTMGRAARNANGAVILYADTITPEMSAALGEVERRRAKQIEYNARHGITPETIVKAIRRGIEQELAARKVVRAAAGRKRERTYERDELLRLLEQEMLEAAQRLEFEKAAALRDRIRQVKELPEFADAEGRMTIALPPEAEDGRLGDPRGRGGRRKGEEGAKSGLKPGMARSRAGISGPKKRRGR
jgi:excinuclease ABC subunit B